MKPPLTEKQAEVLAFLNAQHESTGVYPTIREQMDHHGIRSPNGMLCHLKALAKKGYLTRGPKGHARSYRVPEAPAPRLTPDGVRLGPWLLTPEEALGLASELRRLATEEASHV